MLNSYVKEDNSLLSVLYGKKEIPVEVYDSFAEQYRSVIGIAIALSTYPKKL